MRIIIFLLALSSLSFCTFAQTTRMIDPFVGRTFSGENLRRTTFPLLIKADKQFRMLNFEESLFMLENAVAQNPYSSEALVLRARLKRILGMETEARQDLSLAQRINPYAASLYGFYGNAGLLNILANYPEQAIEELSNSQKLHYYHEMLDRRSGLYEVEPQKLEITEKVIEEIRKEQVEVAAEWVEELLSQYPDAELAYDLKGLVLMKKQKWQEAAASFTKALELNPGFAIAWYNLGQTEVALGNEQKAKKCFDKAIELQPSLTKAYFDRALLLSKTGDREKAIQDYNRIIELTGNTYPEAYLNRGLTKKMNGDLLGASMDLNTVIDQSPDNARLYKNRGNLQLLYGLPLKAIEDYSLAIQLNGQYAEAYYNRGLAHLVVFDAVSGCYDLNRSAELGYEKAKEKQKYFCGGILNQ